MMPTDLVVLPYIEANPLRVRRVADPPDDRWSGCRRHGIGQEDSLLSDFPERDDPGWTGSERRWPVASPARPRPRSARSGPERRNFPNSVRPNLLLDNRVSHSMREIVSTGSLAIRTTEHDGAIGPGWALRDQASIPTQTRPGSHDLSDEVGRPIVQSRWDAC